MNGFQVGVRGLHASGSRSASRAPMSAGARASRRQHRTPRVLRGVRDQQVGRVVRAVVDDQQHARGGASVGMLDAREQVARQDTEALLRGGGELGEVLDQQNDRGVRAAVRSHRSTNFSVARAASDDADASSSTRHDLAGVAERRCRPRARRPPGETRHRRRGGRRFDGRRRRRGPRSPASRCRPPVPSPPSRAAGGSRPLPRRSVDHQDGLHRRRPTRARCAVGGGRRHVVRHRLTGGAEARKGVRPSDEPASDRCCDGLVGEEVVLCTTPARFREEREQRASVGGTPLGIALEQRREDVLEPCRRVRAHLRSGGAATRRRRPSTSPAPPVQWGPCRSPGGRRRGPGSRGRRR